MKIAHAGRLAAFAILNFLLVACGGGGGSSTPPPTPPTITLTANPTSVVSGNSTNLSWSSTNATSCTASGGWSGTKTTSGSEVSAALTANATFTLDCTGSGGSASVSAGVTVTQPTPQVTLTAAPTSVAIGSSSTLTWSASNVSSCTATAQPANANWSGTKALSGTQSTGTLSASTTFTLNCSGPNGNGSASVTVNTVTNNPPIANAGSDRSVFSGASVTLSGASSADSDGTIASYAWTQTAGPAVALSPSGSDASFTAPSVGASTTLTFRLIVTDNLGATSAPATVIITVQPLAAGQVPISGRITFARIPVTTTGWNYAGTTQQPARGITVELVNTGNNTVITSGPSDSGGFYSLAAPANTLVFVRARAELLKTGTAPTWNIRVQDVDGGNVVATSRSSDVNSGSGITQNIAIQSGWGLTASSAPIDPTRPAAPFAILDTVYRAITKLQALNPSIVLPALVIDWAPNNTGGVTFFTESSSVGPKIVLAAEINVDTDEYDAQVVAHEFGHYVEWAFGRADSIGGTHGFGDRLDPRVAWGEGFGYFWAGFVNDDSLMLDSGGANQQGSPNRFDIETSVRNPGWWSESSVWSILWDLYDNANEAGDTASLGATPIWTTLTGGNKNTSAFVTILSFVAQLKVANPTQASAIDGVVASQNIVAATIDDFGTTQNAPSGFPEVVPIYRPLTLSASPLTVPSNILFPGDTGNGTTNKLGIRHYFRLDVPSGRTSIRIDASTAVAGQDPDVQVFRRGVLVGDCSNNGNEIACQVPVVADTYVIESYECNNAGCNNGTAANTTISLTVQ